MPQEHTWAEHPDFPGSKLYAGSRGTVLRPPSVHEAVRLLTGGPLPEEVSVMVLPKDFPRTHYTDARDYGSQRGVRVVLPEGDFDPTHWVG